MSVSNLIMLTIYNYDLNGCNRSCSHNGYCMPDNVTCNCSAGYFLRDCSLNTNLYN